ncbi:MAG: GIY-YIG nuclease family protein [Candidatus Aenigmarchaeota archaeon]|nr:GIY-YIG nuclease family protein [Candidatus Aenigmarchaeota archaeon]
MKGAYVIVLEVEKDCSLAVGALGELHFRKGIYLYVGSAMNNLEKRTRRHLRKEKTLRWHIDYLTVSPFVNVRAVYFRESSRKEECEIAGLVAKHGTPVMGFGCSDCRCHSHLFQVSDEEFLKGTMKRFFGAQDSRLTLPF